METLFNSWEHIPLTENFIKQFHRDLLIYSEKDEWHRGSYKTTSNSVAAFDETGIQIGVVFETATPFETPDLMEELVSWINQEREAANIHPLFIISIFKIVFLEIHPFQDGNGRLSRVLTNLLLLQAGYVYVPYSSLESVIEQNKESYYLPLRETQGTIRTENPDWQPWITFFLRAMQKQKQRLEKKIENEKLIIAKLPDLSIRIMDFAKEQGRVSIGEMVRLTGANRNTLKQHFRVLVEKNYLSLQGGGRSAWYVLK